jgi:hypothetical protein
VPTCLVGIEVLPSCLIAEAQDNHALSEGVPVKVLATEVKLAMPPPTTSARRLPSGFAVALQVRSDRCCGQRVVTKPGSMHAASIELPVARQPAAVDAPVEQRLCKDIGLGS